MSNGDGDLGRVGVRASALLCRGSWTHALSESTRAAL